MSVEDAVARIAGMVSPQGFAFVAAPDMRAAFETAGSLADWKMFADSWNDLGLDTYMADGGRYRKRRHAVYAAGPDGLRRKPHQAHYQSRDYNKLNGGIARWFDPVLPAIGAGPTMTAVLSFCRALFERLSHAEAGETMNWHVEVHQFRIEARAGEHGQPTPEGMHQDGVDHVLVLLVGRRNVIEGVTAVADLAKRVLGSFTLAEPFDAAIVDDNRVMHGVTPVAPEDRTQPGFRDVLVVTFRRER